MADEETAEIDHSDRLPNSMILAMSSNFDKILALCPRGLGAKNPDRFQPRRREEDEIDHLELLPDSLILEIFNLIGDAKVLGRCCVVSRRFHSLAPRVHAVTVRADFIIPTWYLTRRHVLVTHLLPIGAKNFILDSATSSSPLQRFPMHLVLNNFKEIRCVHIKLPVSEIDAPGSGGGGGGGGGGGLIFKWKVEIGSSLNRFAIFTAWISRESSNPNPFFTTHYPNIRLNQDACAYDRMRHREAWLFTSLAAASARIRSLRPIVADYQTLESLLVTDANGQGVLAVDLKQGPKVSMKSLTTWLRSKRTRLWCAPKLELPGRMVLHDATLMVRDKSTADTVDPSIRNRDHHWICNSFEEPFRTAVNMLLQTKNELGDE